MALEWNRKASKLPFPDLSSIASKPSAFLCLSWSFKTLVPKGVSINIELLGLMAEDCHC